MGHEKGTPFAPGANPENGIDTHGMVASMLSVGKLDYNDALDGISLTNTITIVVLLKDAMPSLSTSSSTEAG